MSVLCADLTVGRPWVSMPLENSDADHCSLKVLPLTYSFSPSWEVPAGPGRSSLHLNKFSPPYPTPRGNDMAVFGSSVFSAKLKKLLSSSLSGATPPFHFLSYFYHSDFYSVLSLYMYAAA